MLKTQEKIAQGYYSVSNVPLKTQCAWCNRMTQDGTAYGIPLAEKLLDASHGICEDCTVEMLKNDEGGQG